MLLQSGSRNDWWARLDLFGGAGRERILCETVVFDRSDRPYSAEIAGASIGAEGRRLGADARTSRSRRPSLLLVTERPLGWAGEGSRASAVGMWCRFEFNLGGTRRVGGGSET